MLKRMKQEILLSVKTKLIKLQMEKNFMKKCKLDKKLRKEFGKRSLSVRRGDEVLVMRGSFKGKIGKVSSVDLRESKVYIETVKRKKVSGQEIEVPVDPSNLKIVRLYMEDKKRRKFFERKKTKVEKKKEK